MKRKEARQMIYNMVRQYYGKQPTKMSHEDEIDFEKAVHCEHSSYTECSISEEYCGNNLGVFHFSRMPKGQKWEYQDIYFDWDRPVRKDNEVCS